MIPQRLEAEGSFSHTFGRTVAVPRAWLEIAELLVHAIKLGKRLGDETVGRAVIGEEVVADAVSAGPPKELVAVEAE
jgi:hypothetical protein